MSEKRFLCLNCLNENFEPKTINVPQSLGGKEFFVRTKVMVCCKCNWFTASDDQADKLCVLTIEKANRCD